MQHLLRLAAAFSLALSTLALSEKELKANFEFDFDTFDFKDSDYKEKPPDVGGDGTVTAKDALAMVKNGTGVSAGEVVHGHEHKEELHRHGGHDEPHAILHDFPLNASASDALKEAGIEYFAFLLYDASTDASGPMLWAEAHEAADAFQGVVAFIRVDVSRQDHIYHALTGRKLGSRELLPKLVVSNHKTRKNHIHPSLLSSEDITSFVRWAITWQKGEPEPKHAHDHAAHNWDEDHDLVPAVTNATFRDEVIAPHNDVLVKVYASWSRASSELAKPYAQVAYYFDSKGESREQKLLVTKIDGSRYKVPELDAHALPSLFLFPRYDKRHALRYEGDLSYDSIVKWVEAHRPGGHVHDEL